MNVENPNEHSPQGPEQKEWRGKRWEYLVAKVIDDYLRVEGRTEWKFLKGDFEKDPVAEFYNMQLRADSKEKLSIVEGLNLLGQDGWEVVSATPTYSMDGTGTPFLFFKRPLASP